jgi:putative FmdB family regulatory protein
VDLCYYYREGVKRRVPIYEYVCQDCLYRFEVKQKLSDPPLSGCARCGKAVSKVISAPAIMFKGSGWYVTDYSEKLKPPDQSTSAGQPANGQKDQKSQSPSPTTGAPPVSTKSSNEVSGTSSESSSTPSTAASSTSSS